MLGFSLPTRSMLIMDGDYYLNARTATAGCGLFPDIMQQRLAWYFQL
jgi:hypothetical protein